MATVHFDNGDNFLQDFEGLVNVCKAHAPAIIVVASEREVNTFNKYFAESAEGVSCMTFATFYIEASIAADTNVYAYRVDDIFKKLAGRGEFKGMTVRGRKRVNKEEE